MTQLKRRNSDVKYRRQVLTRQAAAVEIVLAVIGIAAGSFSGNILIGISAVLPLMAIAALVYALRAWVWW